MHIKILSSPLQFCSTIYTIPFDSSNLMETCVYHKFKFKTGVKQEVYSACLYNSLIIIDVRSLKLEITQCFTIFCVEIFFNAALGSNIT